MKEAFMNKKKGTNAITPFNFENNLIRTVVDDGNYWFVAKDIAEALGYTWGRHLLDKVPEEWKGVKPFPSLGGKQETSVLSEQELYFFLNRSDKPKAIPFQKWIVSEVDSWRSYSLHP